MRTRYLLEIWNNAICITPDGKPKTMSLHFSLKRRGTIIPHNYHKAQISFKAPGNLYVNINRFTDPFFQSHDLA